MRNVDERTTMRRVTSNWFKIENRICWKLLLTHSWHFHLVRDDKTECSLFDVYPLNNYRID